ncbi:MAG: hypothetical protein LUG93_19465 [Lachnospiraceae bacterium]|nr:hypothetical protein [Lachnospiraceae bacterium]
MKANEIIREIMKIKEVKPSVLASRLNIKNNVLSERLGQKNISTEKLNEMVRVLDYKIVIVPRESRIPEGGFEVD